LRLLWNVLRGNDGPAEQPVKGSRIAVWDEDPAFPLASEVQNAVRRAADALARQGVGIGNAKPPVDGAELMGPYM
jgi:Asp-tRNA(Asn)/Glu-tRNA(Gln) amidotransferase A subunit family amidase